MYINNGSDFELKVLNETNSEDLRAKFIGINPDFSRDAREVVSRRGESRFPNTPLARSFYFAVKEKLEERMRKIGVQISELYMLSTIGTMLDLYWETDCLIYLKTACGQEAIVSIDLFYMDKSTLLSLREFWIDSSSTPIYSQGHFHADLLRHTRIYSDFKKKKFDIPQEPSELKGLYWKKYYKKLWVSGYVPQADIVAINPERGKEGYENQVVITPHQIQNRSNRNVLAGFISDLLVRQIVLSPCLCAS